MFSRGQSTRALAAALHTAEEPCTHPAEKEKKTDTDRQPRPTPHGPNHHLTGSTSRWTGQQQNCRNRTNTVRHLKELELLKLLPGKQSSVRVSICVKTDTMFVSETLRSSTVYVIALLPKETYVFLLTHLHVHFFNQ